MQMEGRSTVDGEEHQWLGIFHPSGAFLVENQSSFASTKSGWTAQAGAAAWVQDASNLIESLQLDDHEALVLEILVCSSCFLRPEAKAHVNVLAAYALSDGVTGSFDRETSTLSNAQAPGATPRPALKSALRHVPPHSATSIAPDAPPQHFAQRSTGHVAHHSGQAARILESPGISDFVRQLQVYGQTAQLSELEGGLLDDRKMDSVRDGSKLRLAARQPASGPSPESQLRSKEPEQSDQGVSRPDGNLRCRQVCAASSTVEVVIAVPGGRCLATVIVNPRTWRPQALLQRRYGALESWDYASWRLWKGSYWFPGRMQHTVRGEVVSVVFVASAEPLEACGRPTESPFRRPARPMWPEGTFASCCHCILPG
jgi:hypothetical protein